MPITLLRRLVRPSLFSASVLPSTRLPRPSIAAAVFPNASFALPLRPAPASRAHKCTLIQVLRGGRAQRKARKLRSPQLKDRPELKGVCLKVGTTKPKKPNSGERKIARVRLSTGKVITAYIPGEGMVGHGKACGGDGANRGIGHNVQQHSVVMVRGGRAQDCPGVKYHLVRGALDLVRYHALRHAQHPLTGHREVSAAESHRDRSTEPRSPRPSLREVVRGCMYVYHTIGINVAFESVRKGK